MEMASLIFHPFLWLCLAIFVVFPAATRSSSSSIYDHLQLNGLPIGLLPKGISDFSLDPLTNCFLNHFPHPCNARFKPELHYDFNMSEVLTFNKIDQLSGMSQQELFVWFPVRGICVDDPASSLIHLDVGVVDKRFFVSLFESPHDCTATDPTSFFAPKVSSLLLFYFDSPFIHRSRRQVSLGGGHIRTTARGSMSGFIDLLMNLGFIKDCVRDMAMLVGDGIQPIWEVAPM